MVIHDGYKNTFTFVKDGVKIVLGSSKLESVPKPCKMEGDNLLTQYKCEVELGISSKMYVLVIF